MELTSEHVEILKQTERDGRCSVDSPEMRDLCKLKMIEFVRQIPIVPAPYYRLMADGKSALADLRELGR